MQGEGTDMSDVLPVEVDEKVKEEAVMSNGSSLPTN